MRPLVSTCNGISNVSLPRSTVATVSSPLIVSMYFLESCTNGVETLSKAIILSSLRRPADAFSEPVITESTMKGTAKSNRPGVFSTSPIMDLSM